MMNQFIYNISFFFIAVMAVKYFEKYSQQIWLNISNRSVIPFSGKKSRYNFYKKTIPAILQFYFVVF